MPHLPEPAAAGSPAAPGSTGSRAAQTAADRDAGPAAESGRLSTEFEGAVAWLRHESAGIDHEVRLVKALRALDAHRGPDGDTLREQALSRLARTAGTLLQLDRALRGTAEIRYAPAGDPGARGDGGFWAHPAPLGLALASCHPDGRVRERAVRRIAALLTRGDAPAALVAFLALRTADWAAPVRERARGALAVLLDAHPARLLPHAVPTADALARRWHGGFARQQVLSVLTAAHGVRVLDELAGSGDARLRRFAVPVAVAAGRIRLRALAALAGTDPERRLRGSAAQAAVREAVWTEQFDVLRRLATSGDSDVRALALTGLVRAGRADEAVGHLGDPAPLVRATAREAARRTGAEPLAWYRAAAVADPTPGVVRGLAETGRGADADLLVPLLAHPEPRIRAAAVRGLLAMDAVPVARVLPLLRDASGRVVREAAAALSARTGQLPPGLAESLLADTTRPAVRRAGLRLLAEPDPVRRLLLLLRATADPDPRLSRRAANAVAGLVREVHPTRTSYAPPVPFAPTQEQKRQLWDAASAVSRLAEDHPRMLRVLGELCAPMDPLTELLRLRSRWDRPVPSRLPLAEATFSAPQAWRAVQVVIDVLLTVLPYATGPAERWPADEDWPGLLGDVLPAAAPQPAGWRELVRKPRAAAGPAESEALSAWLRHFHPNAPSSARGWRWWDATPVSATRVSLRFTTDGDPYGGRDALRRLIEAAGGYDVDLP